MSALQLSWSAQNLTAGSGTAYDIVTGTLSQLRSVGGFGGSTCLASSVPAGNYDDVRTGPPIAEGYYYLVRARNTCGLGTFGDSGHAPDPRDGLDASPPCP